MATHYRTAQTVLTEAIPVRAKQHFYTEMRKTVCVKYDVQLKERGNTVV